MPFTAWKEEERNTHRDRKKYLLNMTSGGFMTLVRNNSLMTVNSIL